MKLTFTADLHFKENNNFEKFKVLNKILSESKNENISNIIISGDLFDSNYSDYSDFENNILQKNKNIFFHILPGNHDFKLQQKYFISKNIKIYNNPELIEFSNKQFLFIPFSDNYTISEVILNFYHRLRKNQWYLISHCDFIDSSLPKNLHENKLYMPLTRKDIEKFLPRYALLGHIHKPYNNNYIYYAGSPYPLDINETGRRRFLVIDTDRDKIISKKVNTKIYFNEKIFLIPVKDEIEFLSNKIGNLKSKWNLSEEEQANSVIRLEIYGYTTDKNKIYKKAKLLLKDFTFESDLISDNLKNTEDIANEELLNKIIKGIQDLNIQENFIIPDKNIILEKAIKLLYSE